MVKICSQQMEEDLRVQKVGKRLGGRVSWDPWDKSKEMCKLVEAVRWTRRKKKRKNGEGQGRVFMWGAVGQGMKQEI